MKSVSGGGGGVRRGWREWGQEGVEGVGGVSWWWRGGVRRWRVEEVGGVSLRWRGWGQVEIYVHRWDWVGWKGGLNQGGGLGVVFLYIRMCAGSAK